MGIKLVALSDLHGYLPDIEDEFDLMVICGDICPTFTHSRYFQQVWVLEDFAQWINATVEKKGREGSMVILVAGNHDFFFENITKTKVRELESNCNGRLKYLDNEEYVFSHLNEDGTLKDYRIYGTPYCKVFGNWAFMREDLDACFSGIPQGLDILLSHDAADINELGLIKMGRWKGENAGNTVLARYIKERVPKYYFCGHIHSGRHELMEIDGTNSANVAIMDERYEPTYKPLVLEID